MFTFAPIFIALRAAIAAHAARDRVLSAVLGVLWGHVSRMTDRLERLVVLWRAGTLPKPRVDRERVPSGEPRAGVRRQTGPRGRYWLIVHVPGSAGYRSQLEHLMSGAEFAGFVAAVPQARRILSPVCRLLGLRVPQGEVSAIAPQPAPVVSAAETGAAVSAEPAVVARVVSLDLSLPFPRVRRRFAFGF